MLYGQTIFFRFFFTNCVIYVSSYAWMEQGHKHLPLCHFFGIFKRFSLLKCLSPAIFAHFQWFSSVVHFVCVFGDIFSTFDLLWCMNNYEQRSTIEIPFDSEHMLSKKKLKIYWRWCGTNLNIVYKLASHQAIDSEAHDSSHRNIMNCKRYKLLNSLLSIQKNTWPRHNRRECLLCITFYQKADRYEIWIEWHAWWVDIFALLLICGCSPNICSYSQKSMWQLTNGSSQ